MEAIKTGLTYPWMKQASLIKLVAVFQLEQIPLYFIGGCVRDSLLDMIPKDIDLTTPLHPDDIVELLQRHNIFYKLIGKAYGSVMAIVDEFSFEITTFRRDVTTDGRWATVDYTNSLYDDSARRDFTVNAFYLTSEGNLYDPQDGWGDLQAKRLVFIGDPAERIQEDYLRILRFFRFHGQFNQETSMAALDACETYAPHLTMISAERTHHELLGLLATAFPLLSLQLMHQRNIIPSFIIDVNMDLATYERLQAWEITHNIRASPLIRFYILFAQHLETIIKRLAFSRRDQKFLYTIHNRQKDNYCLLTWLYHHGTSLAQAHLILQALNTDANTPNLTVNLEFQQQWQQTLDWQRPIFPLNGHDLTSLGYSGPRLGLALKTVHQWWIDHHFQPSHSDCLHYLKTIKTQYTRE